MEFFMSLFLECGWTAMRYFVSFLLAGVCFQFLNCWSIFSVSVHGVCVQFLNCWSIFNVSVHGVCSQFIKYITLQSSSSEVRKFLITLISLPFFYRIITSSNNHYHLLSSQSSRNTISSSVKWYLYFGVAC